MVPANSLVRADRGLGSLASGLRAHHSAGSGEKTLARTNHQSTWPVTPPATRKPRGAPKVERNASNNGMICVMPTPICLSQKIDHSAILNVVTCPLECAQHQFKDEDWGHLPGSVPRACST